MASANASEHERSALNREHHRDLEALCRSLRSPAVDQNSSRRGVRVFQHGGWLSGFGASGYLEILAGDPNRRMTEAAVDTCLRAAEETLGASVLRRRWHLVAPPLRVVSPTRSERREYLPYWFHAASVTRYEPDRDLPASTALIAWFQDDAALDPDADTARELAAISWATVATRHDTD